MNIDWKKIGQLIPVFVGVVNPTLGTLAATIEAEAEKVITQRMETSGLTRDQILAEAAAVWERDIKAAEDLRRLGHEQDPVVKP